MASPPLRSAGVPAAADPRDVATAHTLRFLDRALPAQTRRILEVGCGDGALAAALIARELDVAAIDPSPEAVADARARGVPAVEADVLQFEAPAFDAVLFTRSLHHVWPLDAAVETARRLVRPGGLLVLEEMALEAIDPATARFRYDLEALAIGSGLMAARDEEHEHGGIANEPLRRWREDHAHDPAFHEGAAMLAAVRARFAIRRIEPAAYVYRYLVMRLEVSERGASMARAAFAVESARLREGSVRPLGLRIVAAR